MGGQKRSSVQARVRFARGFLFSGHAAMVHAAAAAAGGGESLAQKGAAVFRSLFRFASGPRMLSAAARMPAASAAPTARRTTHIMWHRPFKNNSAPKQQPAKRAGRGVGRLARHHAHAGAKQRRSIRGFAPVHQRALEEIVCGERQRRGGEADRGANADDARRA